MSDLCRDYRSDFNLGIICIYITNENQCCLDGVCIHAKKENDVFICQHTLNKAMINLLKEKEN